MNQARMHVGVEFTHFSMSGEPTGKNGGEKCGNRPPFSVEYRIAKHKPQGGCRAMNDTKIASKTKAQLAHFMGKLQGDCDM